MRWLRADFIEVSKIMNGFENGNSAEFFKPSTATYKKRGYSKRLHREICRLDNFKNLVISEWNALSERAVTATSEGAQYESA